MSDTTKCANPYIVYLMAPETHCPYCPTISKAPLTGRQEFILRRQENGLALDNSSYTRDSVAARSGHLVHVGWLHPHPARLGDHRHIDPRYPRTQTSINFARDKSELRLKLGRDFIFVLHVVTMRTHRNRRWVRTCSNF